MIQWFINKENKIPLYLQLIDQIKYYISTGAIQTDYQLPPVNVLAKDLGINFETVRKAYKELENDGLIAMKRGQGTFITLPNGPTALSQKTFSRNGQIAAFNVESQFINAAKNLINQFLQQGLELKDAQAILAQAVDELERDGASPIVVFTECNQFQMKEISALLAENLSLKITPMLVADLKTEIAALLSSGKTIHVVTTGFHINEVRQSVGNLPVIIDVLITNLNPETRRHLEVMGEKASYGFICRDQESAVLYKDLLKAELGFEKMNLSCCTLAETEKVIEILQSADVVLTSPPVYEEVKKLASADRGVFNVFERIDPMSLKVVKDRILQGKEYST